MSVQYTRYNRVDLNGKFICRFRGIVKQTRVSDILLELCLVDRFDVSKTVGNDVTWRQRLLGNQPRDEVMIRNIMGRPNLDGRDAIGVGGSDEEIEHVIGGGVMRGGGYVLTQAVIIEQREQLRVDGPMLWNLLPLEILNHEQTLESFKAKLKTYLFTKAYFS